MTSKLGHQHVKDSNKCFLSRSLFTKGVTIPWATFHHEATWKSYIRFPDPAASAPATATLSGLAMFDGNGQLPMRPMYFADWRCTLVLGGDAPGSTVEIQKGMTEVVGEIVGLPTCDLK